MEHFTFNLLPTVNDAEIIPYSELEIENMSPSCIGMFVIVSKDHKWILTFDDYGKMARQWFDIATIPSSAVYLFYSKEFCQKGFKSFVENGLRSD